VITTGGGRENSFGIDPHTVYIQWGPTGLYENRVWINTFDYGFSKALFRIDLNIVSNIQTFLLNLTKNSSST